MKIAALENQLGRGTIMKRLLDLVVAAALLLLFSPIILLVAVLIRLKLGAPVFFKQKRPGLYGNSFYLYKFRSMTNERNEDGELLPDYLRLTSFGAFLRKYSLDELPQLINVLKDELSLVGPRPLLMDYLPLYTEDQAKRHLVRPGITGWAQVNGRNTISWEEKFRFDIWYVENRSFRLDVKILCLTLFKVLKSEGIHQENQVTMEKFTGSKFI
jgi:sugar transferase EpsL